MRFIIRRLHDDRILRITGSKQRADIIMQMARSAGCLVYLETAPILKAA